ncbi:protein odr-4 homolog [Spea bombifrons]|uniref:protein odr-4 homolog n=1 Tax=Spea bombifrons TaxID=233779 RepID=UPI00234B845E|nr:protein odr-4 homolog [Spea bombifrons]
MGRSYYVEDAVEKYFTQLIQLQKPYVTGLIIGQCSLQRDYVILAAQTPQKDNGEESEKKAGLTKLDEIDDEWVSMHASQVSRMLPGGLLVIGVFLITSPDLSKESQNALRKLIFSVEKSSVKNRLWRSDDSDVSERVAVHICSATRKIVCRTFDVKDHKSAAKPADWKYQSSPLSWLTIECNMCVDVTIPLSPSSSSYQERHKSIRTAVTNWAKELDDVVILFNGRVKDKDGDLIEEQKKSSRSSSQTIKASILAPSLASRETRSTALIQVCKSSLTIQGIVKCRAYIQSNKPKVNEALQALKRDILNTMSDRCEILFEDIILNGPQNESEKTTCQLPQRVFVPIHGSNLMLCDYVFGDEAAEDLQSRFLEMLDQNVQYESIDFAEEKSSRTKPDEEQEVDVSCHSDTKDQPKALTNSLKSSKLQQNIGVVMAATIALVAILLSFQYLLE